MPSYHQTQKDKDQTEKKTDLKQEPGSPVHREENSTSCLPITKVRDKQRNRQKRKQADLLIKYSVTSDNKEDEDKNESTHAAFSK